jgi:hypothetical protein
MGGPASTRLANYIGEEERANSYIASNFWKALTSSTYMAQQNYLGLGLQIFSASEKIIVYSSSRNQFDLLLFCPIPVEARSFQIQLGRDQISDGWISWSRQITGRLDPVIWNPYLAVEALSGRFGLAIMQRPSMQRVSVPNPPAQIQCPAGNSTAGVVAQLRGKDGVTGALHAVHPHTTVTIAGASYNVVASDAISDACFIEIDPPPGVGAAVSQGVMRNMLPRGKQVASFGRGSSRGTVNTTISGWALELPHINLNRQDKVYTTNDLSTGDSGSALVTDDGYVIGFAFEEASGTGANDPSSWIWAHSVVEALDLTIK